MRPATPLSFRFCDENLWLNTFLGPLFCDKNVTWACPQRPAFVASLRWTTGFLGGDELNPGQVLGSWDNVLGQDPNPQGQAPQFSERMWG